LAADIPAGKVIHTRGEVEIISVTQKAAVPGQILRNGDIIRTGSDGWIAVVLSDETLLQLNRNSRFTLKEVADNAGWNLIRNVVVTTIRNVSNSRYTLNAGEGWFRNKNRNTRIDIEAFGMVAGVRGTELDLKLSDDGIATVAVLEGRITASSDLSSLDVRAGEQAIARPGRPITKSILLTPEDAVQWTIPIPPLFDDRGVPPEVRAALADLQAGNVKQTQQRMADFTARNPEQVSGWSLLALSHIILGRSTEALQAANKAVQTEPVSANALIIQGYAFQAAFDMDRALESLKQALRIDGENVLALVNLARLQFGMDLTDQALENLEKARRIAPQNGDVYNLEGFVLLAGRRTDEAIAAFRRASELDPSLGEPHIGLGLAYMRKGDAALALEEVTAAVLLEPRRSLFLSYWGKMLHQLERFDKALDVLKTAAILDPRDPTPDFYQALILRDLNRPVEAIQAINRAVGLNDNRAVYRSRFLLDRDLAAKNVDLSVLFNQLGLSGWARNKAAAAVKQDYLNSSGHLFLGGALTAEDDRTWPASGEYLLARLLQPANLNTFNTFNEYTSFFERPGIGGTISGSIGNDGVRGGDFVTYGAVPGHDVAFGAQLSYNETNGWRDTNGERRGNLALMAKWDASQQDSLMAVMSHQKFNQRDKAYPRFEYDDPADPNDWLDDRLTRYELGYHRHLSPRSDLLVYLSRMEYRGDLFDHQVLGPIDARAGFQQPYYQVQAEYLLKVAGHQLIAGTTQYWGDNDLSIDYSLVNIRISNEKKRRLDSYFLSDIWKLTPSVTVEGSLYFDHLQNSDAGYGTEWHLREWSPRLGLVFTPTAHDTFRVAVFRYLLPFIASRIDPMDVGGVSVYRNAFEGSLVDEADFVWERAWSGGYLSTGLFYLERQYHHAVVNGNVESMLTDTGRQKGFEVLLNQLIGHGFGLAARYRFQDVGEGSNPAYDREDHLAGIGLRYLHTSGFSFSVLESYRHERFKVANRVDENIWLTDARIGYEFPRKRGSLSLEMRNVFNQHFNWVTDYFVSAGRASSRETILTLSVNF